jgi:hypothetical protein
VLFKTKLIPYYLKNAELGVKLLGRTRRVWSDIVDEVLIERINIDRKIKRLR